MKFRRMREVYRLEASASVTKVIENVTPATVIIDPAQKFEGSISNVSPMRGSFNHCPIDTAVGRAVDGGIVGHINCFAVTAGRHALEGMALIPADILGWLINRAHNCHGRYRDQDAQNETFQGLSLVIYVVSL